MTRQLKEAVGENILNLYLRVQAMVTLPCFNKDIKAYNPVYL